MITRITLGTVQLGLNYGINNKIGKPSKEYALKILAFAEDNGIKSFDTASSYGDSEKILGAFFKGKEHEFFITTKLNSMTKENIKKENVESKVLEEIRKSLDNLNVEYVDNYLIHDFTDLLRYDNLLEALTNAKDLGLIKNIGASIYTPEEAQKILEMDIFSTIQLPINIFNQSFIKSGILKKLKQQNYLIFARSIFLQGLFFMEINRLPDKYNEIIPYLMKLKELSQDKNLKLSTIAINFVKRIREIDSIVMGIETIDQLEQNIQDFNKTIDLNINYSNFNNIDDKSIDPSNW